MCRFRAAAIIIIIVIIMIVIIITIIIIVMIVRLARPRRQDFWPSHAGKGRQQTPCPSWPWHPRVAAAPGGRVLRKGSWDAYDKARELVPGAAQPAAERCFSGQRYLV